MVLGFGSRKASIMITGVLVGVLVLTFNIQPVMASGTPYYCNHIGDVTVNQYEDSWDNNTPTYDLNSIGTNNTYGGRPVQFYVNWSDNTALNRWKIGTNNSGSWVNSTWYGFFGTWSRYNSTTLNDAVDVVGFRFYAADIYGNVNNSMPTITVQVKHQYAVTCLPEYDGYVYRYTESGGGYTKHDDRYMEVGNCAGSMYRAYIKWDISNLPSNVNVSDIETVEIQMYSYYSTDNDRYIHFKAYNGSSYGQDDPELDTDPQSCYEKSLSGDRFYLNMSKIAHQTGWRRATLNGKIAMDLVWARGNGTFFSIALISENETTWNDLAPEFCSMENTTDNLQPKLTITFWTLSGINKVAVKSLTIIPDETYTTGIKHVNINVTVKNEGDCVESFNVTAYLDSNIFGVQTVTLASKELETLTFSLTFADIAVGAYSISAEASVVSGEIVVEDNVLIGVVKVKFPGDVNGDGFIGGYDALLLSIAWWSGKGDSNYNSIADFNGDSFVGGYEATILALHWWTKVPKSR